MDEIRASANNKMPLDRDKNWNEALLKLEARVTRGEVTRLQLDKFYEYWNECRRRYPNLCYPSVWFFDDANEEHLSLEWSFGNVGQFCSFGIFRDGKVDWFYTDRGSDAGSAEEPEDTLPEIIYERLAHFAQNPPMTATT